MVYWTVNCIFINVTEASRARSFHSKIPTICQLWTLLFLWWEQNLRMPRSPGISLTLVDFMELEIWIFMSIWYTIFYLELRFYFEFLKCITFRVISFPCCKEMNVYSLVDPGSRRVVTKLSRNCFSSFYHMYYRRSGCRSVGIVCSQTHATEFSLSILGPIL
jgi:hypothetical protein